MAEKHQKSPLKCHFGVFWSGLWGIGWGVTAYKFGILQFVAKFATGRNRRRGLRNNDKDT